MKNEELKTRRRKVNPRAQQIVLIATEKGYSYEDIADICNVSMGSVKRWISTGRADADKIKLLEEKIGALLMTPEMVAETLIDLYKKRKKRFRLGRHQLRQIAGRSALKGAFLDQLNRCLFDKGFYFLDAFEGDSQFFIVISSGRLLKHVKELLSKDEIGQYYTALADEVEELEEND